MNYYLFHELRDIFIAQVTSYLLHTRCELLFIARVTIFFIARVASYFLIMSYNKDKDDRDVVMMMLL